MLSPNSYKINWNKLAVLLLPIMMRKDIFIAFLKSFFSGLSYDNNQLVTYRNETIYRLTHNGQVCYLRAVLNDYFDNDLRRIEIGDVEKRTTPIIYWRETGKLVGLPSRNGSGLIIPHRGFSGTSGYDFVIKVPKELYEDSKTMAQIRALTSEYKLASKQFDIILLEE